MGQTDNTGNSGANIGGAPCVSRFGDHFRFRRQDVNRHKQGEGMTNSGKALALALFAITACDSSVMGPEDESLELRATASTQGSVLAEARAATAQFHDVNVAIAAGYAQATQCLAGEGIRYRKQSLIFDGVIDVTEPYSAATAT